MPDDTTDTNDPPPSTGLPWVRIALGALGGAVVIVAGIGYVLFNLADKPDPLAELPELQPTIPTLLAYAEDERWMAVAHDQFIAHCATCHGTRGQGLSGPNLTDDLYLNVRRIEDIHDIIVNGRNHNAMPSWKFKLSNKEMVLLSAYVVSLRGKHLKGRPPHEQAIELPPWDAP